MLVTPPTRWEQLEAHVEARWTQPDLATARAQHWEVLCHAAADLVLCEDPKLSLHERLSLRARLYRSYTDLSRTYVLLAEAATREGKLGVMVDTLRQQGLLPETFTL